MASRPRPDFNFSTVLDAVSDLGMDPNGNDPIDDAFRSAEGDGVLIQFPPGTYLVTDDLVARNVSHFGMQGMGSTPADVSFTVPSGYSDFWLSVTGTNDHVLLENFAIDQRQDWTTAMIGRMHVQRGGLMKDIVQRGWEPGWADKTPDKGGEDVGAWNIYCKGSGELVLDNYQYVPEKVQWDDYPDGSIGFFTNNGHDDGVISFINCFVKNAAEHGIYGGRTNGQIRIEDSVFKNCVNTAVRIGGGEGSWVKGTAFIWDSDWRDNQVRGHDKLAYNGLVWDTRPVSVVDQQDRTGGLVENCDFYCVDMEQDKIRGMLIIAGNYGAVDVVNSRFHTEVAGATPIMAESPSTGPGPLVRNGDSLPPKPWNIEVQGCHFTGNSAGESERHAVIDIRGRDGNVISGCCINVPGGRDGVNIQDQGVYGPTHSSGGTVRNCSITVDGQQVIGATTSGITSGKSCIQASPEGGSQRQYDHQATVLAEVGNDAFGYELTTTGEIAPDLSSASPPDTSQDFEGVRQNDNGTWTAFGRVGYGGADAWVFDGDFVGFNIEQGYSLQNDVTLNIDGETVPLGGPQPPQNLSVDSVGDDSVVVSWDPPSGVDVDHYNVYLNGSQAQQTASTSAEVVGMGAGTHQIGVTTVDVNTNESSAATVTVDVGGTGGGGEEQQSATTLAGAMFFLGAALAASRIRKSQMEGR